MKLSKSIKRMKRYAKNGVVVLLGTLAIAIVLQHILTFMLLALVLAGMFYILRYNYA